jgi:hypothetical protein
MKRCNNCFRYALGDPPYCTYCGRTYDKRICSKGHVLGRNAQFCPTCGSNDMSEPAPPETLLAWASRWTLQIAVGSFIGLVLFALGASVVVAIDWSQLVEPLVSLVLVLCLLYWATTTLPGPVKKVGKAAGRGVVRMMKTKRNESGSRRSR